MGVRVKVKNAWIVSAKIRELNKKLAVYVRIYLDKEYTTQLRTELLATVKIFISREKLADDTPFKIHLEKKPLMGTMGIYHTSYFKGISIIA